MPWRSTHLQRTTTASREDDCNPDMPEFCPKGYCSSDEEDVHSSDEEDKQLRTRRRCVFDNTPPGQIGTAALDAFPPLTVRVALPRFRALLMSPSNGGTVSPTIRR